VALLESDPVVFKRDVNGDLVFPLQLARGIEAIGIGVRTRLLMFRGEWFLDLDAGIPYLESQDGTVSEREAWIGGKYDPVRVRADILREILTTPGVLDVPTLRIVYDGGTRTLSISWVARSRFGDTPLDTLNLDI
jgi:hypothetical protein